MTTLYLNLRGLREIIPLAGFREAAFRGANRGTPGLFRSTETHRVKPILRSARRFREAGVRGSKSPSRHQDPVFSRSAARPRGARTGGRPSAPPTRPRRSRNPKKLSAPRLRSVKRNAAGWFSAAARRGERLIYAKSSNKHRVSR